MKRNIFFLLSLCIVLLSCSSDNDDPIKEIENKDPFITLKKTNIDFTNEGGEEAIAIESNVTWTAKSSASWCTVSPSSGNKSTESITLSAPANKDYDNRSCTVTIEGGGVSKTITVNQGENLGLLVTQDRYELSNEESTIKVEVKANVKFEVETNDEWITQVETRGLTTSEIEFKIAENDTYSNREGSITIKQKDGDMASTITVYQSQEDAIILTEKDFELSNKAQSIELEVKSNIDYEIIIPEAAKSWVSYIGTRALRTETVVLNIAENKDYDERTVEIIVKDKKTDLQETVTIKQAANRGLIVGTDKYEVSNDGGTIKVEVKANVEFDIEISDSWITQVNTRGLKETKLQFQVAKNKTYNTREGTITIKEKGGNLSSTIKVYQSQEDAIILTEKNFDLSNKAQSIELEVKSNIDYEIIIPETAKSWVSYIGTRALRTETVVLNIAENKDYDERSVEVIVKDKKTDLQETVTIKQAANRGLIVGTDKYEVSNDGGTIEVEVKANVEFDIEISDSWITQVNTRGLKETKLQFQVAKNKTYNNREGTITIKEKGGNLSSTIKVYQSQEDAIILTEKNFDLSNKAQSIELEVKSNIDYEIIIPEAAKSWVSYIGTRALRTETVVLNIAENKDYDERSVEVIVKDKKTDLQETVTIKQAANRGLIVGTDKYELSNDGGTIEVEVKANVEFDIEIADNWITQVKTRGLKETKLQFQVAKNKTYNNREGTITIKEKGGNLSSTIKVYQSQEDAIILTKKDFNLSSEAQLVEVELKSNINYEIIIPETAKSWVSYIGTRALRTETVVLNIADNKDYDERTVEIIVKDKKTDLQETVTIKQAANRGLIISDDKYEVTNDGGIIDVEVKANVEFDIEISDNWITQVNTRGLTETKLQFQVAKNKTHDNREGTITIKEKGGNLSSTIKVYQSQEDALILTEKNFELSNKAQSIELEVKSNIDYEIIIPKAAKSWVSYIETRALRTETVMLDIADNKDYDERTAEIIVKDKKTDLQETVTIKQAANRGLIISDDKYELSNDGGTIEVEVKANVEFDIEIADNWITQVKTRGLTETKLQFQVAKNKTYNNREGTITIKEKGGNLSSIIKVYQTQENAIILSDKVVEVSDRAQILEVIIKTNVDFEVIIQDEGQDWVSYTATRALREETILLNISANNSDRTRSTEVYIKDKLTNLQETLTINQKGNEPGVYWVDKMGTLGTMLTQTQKDTITTMIVKGEINKADFNVLKLQMPKLKYLDLKDVKCEDDKIPEEAFGGWSSPNTNISTIILPKNITTIGEYSFLKCSGLSGSLNLPDGLKMIESSAFWGTSFSGSLNLPDGVMTIGDYAFSFCSSFTGPLTLPNTLEVIGRSAFTSCTGFTGSLQLPNSLKTIGDGAFEGCSGFTGSLTLPNSLKIIESRSFMGTSFSGSLNLPDGLITIGENAFFQCFGFTGSLQLPNSLKTIGDGAFHSCRGFTGSLNLPDGLTAIGREAFANCYNFTGSLTLPDKLTTIGESAFNGCSGFTGSLTIPSELNDLGSYAFKDCTGFNGSLNLSDELTSLNGKAFWGCSGFTGTLTLPDGLTTIPSYSFFGCSGFTGLVLGSNIATIYEDAFKYCSNISGNILFPISLNSIRSGSFERCDKIDAFRFPHTTPPPFFTKMLPTGSKVEVPTSAVATYKATDGWKDYNIVGY